MANVQLGDLVVEESGGGLLQGLLICLLYDFRGFLCSSDLERLGCVTGCN
jgi:hypothetical protein